MSLLPSRSSWYGRWPVPWRVGEGRAANIRMLSGFALLADGEEFAGPKCNGIDGWLFCASRGWALRWCWIYQVAWTVCKMTECSGCMVLLSTFGCREPVDAGASLTGASFVDDGELAIEMGVGKDTGKGASVETLWSLWLLLRAWGERIVGRGRSGQLLARMGVR